METERSTERKSSRAPKVGERMTVYWGVVGARVYRIDECIGWRDDGWLVNYNLVFVNNQGVRRTQVDSDIAGEKIKKCHVLLLITEV